MHVTMFACVSACLCGSRSAFVFFVCVGGIGARIVGQHQETDSRKYRLRADYQDNDVGHVSSQDCSTAGGGSVGLFLRHPSSLCLTRASNSRPSARFSPLCPSSPATLRASLNLAFLLHFFFPASLTNWESGKHCDDPLTSQDIGALESSTYPTEIPWFCDYTASAI